MKQIYRITYPNGKIYVGSDLTGTVLYLGSANKEAIAEDLGLTGSQDFAICIRKEVLWESETAADSEVRALEVQAILGERSNDPSVGYNRWPRFRTQYEADWSSAKHSRLGYQHDSLCGDCLLDEICDNKNGINPSGYPFIVSYDGKANYFSCGS